MSVLFPRLWEMPNKYTFKMRVVDELLRSEMAGVWADPFCGLHSPAQLRNDADPANQHATSQQDGLEFLASIPDNDGTAGRAEYWAKCKDEIGRIVKAGGKAICFGWDSTGIGKKRGFALQTGLLICHGACHNDTIVTVEIKL